MGNIVYLGFPGAHDMELGVLEYWITCYTTTVGPVIGEDWISFPIQLLFQDENSNLVLLVDAPDILLEALGGKGWFRSVLFDGFGGWM